MRTAIAMLLFGFQLGAIVYARFVPTRYFCWAPYDIQTDYVATATVDGNIIVKAESSEDLISVSAGLGAAGTVGVAANAGVHVFDLTSPAPKLTHSIPVRDQPGWVTFTMNGRFAIPSTGEIMDVRTKRITTTLTDESGHAVQSQNAISTPDIDKVPLSFSRERSASAGLRARGTLAAKRHTD